MKNKNLDEINYCKLIFYKKLMKNYYLIINI